MVFYPFWIWILKRLPTFNILYFFIIRQTFASKIVDRVEFGIKLLESEPETFVIPGSMITWAVYSVFKPFHFLLNYLLTFPYVYKKTLLQSWVLSTHTVRLIDSMIIIIIIIVRFFVGVRKNENIRRTEKINKWRRKRSKKTSQVTSIHSMKRFFLAFLSFLILFFLICLFIWMSTITRVAT